MFLFTPKSDSMQKSTFDNKFTATDNGVDSVASPYLIPDQSLNLYETQANLDGRWLFLVRLVHVFARLIIVRLI